MADLIELTSAHSPFDTFYVSASRVVLVEPLGYSYGSPARAVVKLEGGDKRTCCEEAAEVHRRIAATAEAHHHA